MEVCEVCGGKAKKRSGRVVRFCSIECRRKGQAKQVMCKHCGKKYMLAKSLVKVNNFCSKTCFDKYQTGERKEKLCEFCGVFFNAKKDHGVWQKFCSRKCFLDGCVRPEPKKCKTCGKEFLAGKTGTGRTSDGRRDYCSNECRHKSLMSGEIEECLNCGKIFYMNPATKKQRGEGSCCSSVCASEYYTREKNKNWKGGRYVDTGSNEIRINHPREGYVGRYPGEHTILAGKIIGRRLLRGEKIIHINRDKSDNRPENLFICKDNSEMVRRFNGGLPFPDKSNLHKYT